MLYITTRNRFDASTTPKALRSDRGSDGGLYLPFRMPAFSEDEIAALCSVNFGQSVAQILNLFFSCGLTGWDVEFCIGRYPAKIADIHQKIRVAELWHNADNCYSRLENALSEKIREARGEEKTTSWLRIAIRIAVLFGVYGEMIRIGAVEEKSLFDISLATGDFSWAMAVWYARQMGLPVANIICGCNENSAVWELLHLGEVRTDIAAVPTTTPDADIALPSELERLISATLGQEEARRFSDVCDARGIYAPKPGTLEDLRKGIFAAVVSKERLAGLIPNVYRTVDYILGPYSALAYGALLDYRARNGAGRTALLLSDRNPICDGTEVAKAMNISLPTLRETLGII